MEFNVPESIVFKNELPKNFKGMKVANPIAATNNAVLAFATQSSSSVDLIEPQKFILSFNTKEERIENISAQLLFEYFYILKVVTATLKKVFRATDIRIKFSGLSQPELHAHIVVQEYMNTLLQQEEVKKQIKKELEIFSSKINLHSGAKFEKYCFSNHFSKNRADSLLLTDFYPLAYNKPLDGFVGINETKEESSLLYALNFKSHFWDLTIDEVALLSYQIKRVSEIYADLQNQQKVLIHLQTLTPVSRKMLGVRFSVQKPQRIIRSVLKERIVL